MDSDFSRTLSLKEIQEGLGRYGIQLSSEDMRLVFHRMDNDCSGTVDFREFVTRLTPTMAACRREVVNEVFDKLDCNRDGVLKIEDLMVTYRSHAEKHARFRSGEWTLEQVLNAFLTAFDSPHNKDGCVTRDEFHQYYAGVSCIIDDDAYFDLVMRQCWALPPKQNVSKSRSKEFAVGGKNGRKGKEK